MAQAPQPAVPHDPGLVGAMATEEELPPSWPQVLVVDDDTSILKLIDAVLLTRGIVSTPVTTIAAAREALEKNSDFAVILCDHLLPDGVGVDLFGELRTEYPDLVRILMTGLYDKPLAMDAINSGEIYRFLSKPFAVEDLLATVSQGIDRHNLIAENTRLHTQLALQNEELRRTNAELSRRVTEEEDRSHGLRAESRTWRQASQGMIDLSLEILQRIDPLLYQHSHRVSILATAIGKEMNLPEEILERLETAAHLHDIGLLGCSPALRADQRHLDRIGDPRERDQIEHHPILSAQLVKFLPLPDVVEAIAQHHEYFDGSGYPEKKAGSLLSVMTRILSVADSYDEAGADSEHALSRIASASGHLYDAEVVHALERAISKGLHTVSERQVLVHELVPGMKLSTSIYTATGMLLVKQGQVLSRSMIEHLQLHAESNALIQRILVEN